MDKSENERYNPLNTLRGAFLGMWKIERNEIVEGVSYIKLSEIKFITEDLRFKEHGMAGSLVKTYKDCEYFSPVCENELLKIINLFIFKQDDYYEMYGA